MFQRRKKNKNLRSLERCVVLEIILLQKKQDAKIIARTPNRANSKSQSSMREKKRIPSNDNCDYTLVVNYLLIIIPNHSDCTFGTIFFSFIQTMSRDGKDGKEKSSSRTLCKFTQGSSTRGPLILSNYNHCSNVTQSN